MFSIITRGFKFCWLTLRFIRELILNIFVLCFILFLLMGYAYFAKKEKNVEVNGPLLILNITGTVIDTKQDDDLAQLQQKLTGKPSRLNENSLFDITQTIEQATDDNAIKGMVLSLDDFLGADISSLQYIGKYLTQFKQQGKPIYAIGSSYDQGQYYLASYANEIYLQPQGTVNLFGFSSNTLFYKELLDKLQVNAHIFRVGTYKSAVEPLIRNDMSSDAKENMSRWLTIIWQNYLADIAKNRQSTPTQLVPDTNTFLSRLKSINGSLSGYALNYKLVDGILTHYDFWQKMQTQFQYSSSNNNALSMYNYPLVKSHHNTDEIAVIPVEGSIVDNNKVIAMGNIPVTELIRKATLNKNVKAVILRVNSPGGSVTASEAIRNELQALRAAGKKVVVSMGGMAASGGYWISTESDAIIASPNTITGSIGVFGIIPTFENSLKQIGVYTDGVSTSELANLSLTKELPESFSTMMQLNIENTYTNFINLVAKARHKTASEIDKIAQGRVWIGSDALANSLVDQLGDFDDAVKKAAELAGLQNFDIHWPQLNKNLWEKLLSSTSVTLPNALISLLPTSSNPLSSEVKKQLNFWQNLTDPNYNYIYCLNCATIR